MLRFFTAVNHMDKPCLPSSRDSPRHFPLNLDFINHELHRRQLGYGRGGRQKIEKTAPISSPECVTARPSVLSVALRIEKPRLGKLGKSSSR